MKITVYVQKGIKFVEEIKYAVIVNDEGEFALLENHADLTTVIKKGCIKIFYNNDDRYIYLTHGLLTFIKNSLNVYALHAEIGDTFELAKSSYLDLMKRLDEQSKQENVDYSLLERDLRQHITKARAGHL